MVESLQDADLSREACEMGTVLAIVVIVVALVVIAIVVVRRAETLWVDDIDGPPFAHRARHRFHHRRGRDRARATRHRTRRRPSARPERGSGR